MLRDRAALYPDWKHWNDWRSYSASNLHTACAGDFINGLSLNKRGMNSSNVLRARSWDGFHKQITQVVHVRGREGSYSSEACCCNHKPGSSYFRSSLNVPVKAWTSVDVNLFIFKADWQIQTLFHEGIKEDWSTQNVAVAYRSLQCHIAYEHPVWHLAEEAPLTCDIIRK